MEEKRIARSGMDQMPGESAQRMPDSAVGQGEHRKRGVIETLAAGISWGFSGTCAQYLFERYEALPPLALCTIRLTIGGLMLLVLVLIWHRDAAKRLLHRPRHMLKLILFAFLGIAFNQLSYLEAIANSNSGTATILQYIGPVLVMAVSCVLARRLPEKKEVLALVLTVAGVFLIATHGRIDALYITPAGLTWGLMAALALVFYTMIPVSLIEEYGALVVITGGFLFGAVGMNVVKPIWTIHLPADPQLYLMLAVILLIGTALPYALYLFGIGDCGAVRASMIASVEPVSATVCMVVWLGEPLYFAELIGFICIFATVFLLTKKEAPPA